MQLSFLLGLFGFAFLIVAYFRIFWSFSCCFVVPLCICGDSLLPGFLEGTPAIGRAADTVDMVSSLQLCKVHHPFSVFIDAHRIGKRFLYWKFSDSTANCFRVAVFRIQSEQLRRNGRLIACMYVFWSNGAFIVVTRNQIISNAVTVLRKPLRVLMMFPA